MYGKLPIYNYYDIVKFRLVRLSKWLLPTEEELAYAHAEWKRITTDKSRTCYVVIFDGKIAVYVDDVTNGAFDSLGDEPG